MKMSKFAKILTLVLVCAALIGAAVGINASATEITEKTVEIVSNNVYYGETLRLAYAVDADSDVTVKIYLDKDCHVFWCDAEEQDDPVTVNGVECKRFYAEKGVPVQDINTYVYAKAVNVNDENDYDIQRYSVLEYLYERLYVSDNISAEQKAMYEAHIEYAEAAEAVLYVEGKDSQGNDRVSQPVVNTSYIQVGENCWLDGNYTSAIYENKVNIFSGEEPKISTDLTNDDENYQIVWRNAKGLPVNTENYVVNGYDKLTASIEEVIGEDEVIIPDNNPIKYTFSNYTAGAQYAENEEHVLDDYVTIYTTQSHFTSELRIYSSSTHDGYAIIKSIAPIDSITVNAGNKVDTLNIYVSEDEGETWTLNTTISVTSTSYNDYSAELGSGYKWIKIDVAGANQVRLKNMTLHFGE